MKLPIRHFAKFNIDSDISAYRKGCDWEASDWRGPINFERRIENLQAA
jgi:hypothetical protein